MNKNIFFAGHFELSGSTDLPLSERLSGDYRSLVLGSPTKLVNSATDLILPDGNRYLGPFYCEKASDGTFTSTICSEVIGTEYAAVSTCDIIIAVLDRECSTGTVVEIEWAIQMEKPMIIYYKVNPDSVYDVQSEYWFVIADVLRRGKNAVVKKYEKVEDIAQEILSGEYINLLP